MENKYSRGKIYKIECNITGNVYIGSTIEPTLARRLARHRSDYNLYNQGNITKYITSVNILEGGDYNIYLIENYPCLSKDELHAREGHYIKEFKAGGNCINIVIPGRTRKEYKNDNKEHLKKQLKIYRLENQEKIREKAKQDRMNNLQKFKEKAKKCYEKNKETILENAKIYYENNKERISIKGKENTICDCGCEIRLDDLKRHLKSQKHSDLINEVKKYKASEKISCECGSEFRYDSLKKHLKSKCHQEKMKNK